MLSSEKVVFSKQIMKLLRNNYTYKTSPWLIRKIGGVIFGLRLVYRFIYRTLYLSLYRCIDPFIDLSVFYLSIYRPIYLFSEVSFELVY